MARRLSASILTAKLVLDTDADRSFDLGRGGGKEPQTTFQAQFEDSKPHAFRLEYVHDVSDSRAGDVKLRLATPVEVLRNEAVKAAQQADAVVAFVGLSPDLEGEEMPIQVPGFRGRRPHGHWPAGSAATIAGSAGGYRQAAGGGLDERKRAWR